MFRKRILRAIGSVVLYMELVLINCANWLIAEWGNVSFSMVVYQLSSPLQGTGPEVIYRFIYRCIILSLIETIVFILFMSLLTRILSSIGLHWGIKAFDKETQVSVSKRKIIIFIYVFVFLVMSISIRNKAYAIGIPAYIRQISNPSSLYEKYYVDPKSVSIDFPAKKKNLIFIYLESMESTYASVEEGGGKQKNYIPNLTKLAEENVSFSNTQKFGGLRSYGGSGWTIAALLTSSTGVSNLIPIQDNTVGDYQRLLPGVTALGDVLEDAGYQNYFMCGSDATFGGRRLLYEEHGDYTIYDYFSAIEDGVIDEDYFEFWGIEDRKLYSYAKEKLKDITKIDEPFNLTLLTVDTHHMNGYICPLCNTEDESPYGNVISCADKQIDQFVSWIQQQEWYKDTVVIIVGDHNSMNNNFYDDLPEGYVRCTYNCFLNVDKIPSNMKERTAYTVDLMPTVLAALDVEIEGNRLGLGTDLFSDRSTLAEEIGDKEFENQSMTYSKFFDEYLIQDRKNRK